jgi:hypothetical protein
MIGIIIVLWIIVLYLAYVGAMVNYLEEELEEIKKKLEK